MKVRASLTLPALILTSYIGSAAPLITSFDPPYGASTDLTFINIHGTGFTGGTATVRFNNTVASTTFVSDDTLIMAKIATGTPLGAGHIRVTVGANFTDSGGFFTVIGTAPFVTNFTPVIGGAGTTVTVQGVNFSTFGTVSSVKFNGVNGTGLFVGSDSQLTVNAPAGVTTGPLLVTSSQGSFNTLSNVVSTATNFFVKPVVTGFSPAFGRAGTNVVLTGTNFLYTTSVKLNNQSVSFTPPTSNTNLQFVVPAGATTGNIEVNNPVNNPVATISNFVVRPLVTGFSPTIGNVGTNVTIFGENLHGTTATTAVFFNGTRANTISGQQYGQINAVVPVGATNGPITVTTTNGTSTSSQNFYLPPQLFSFTPNFGPPGTSVQINGQNFVGATNVTFTGASPVTPTVNNNTSISVVVPAGVTTGPVSVTGPAGTTSSGSVLFYGAPSITSFTPTNGLANTNVTITGINFLGASTVKFNGTSATTVSAPDNTHINTQVPNGATTGPITVITPGGTNISTGNFLVAGADLIVSLSDTPDPVLAGTDLTYRIVISNSGPITATSIVLTNRLPAGVNLKSASTTSGTLNTNGNPVTGALGAIPISGSATITLVVVPQSAGTLTNVAGAVTAFPDPTPANAAASAITTVLPGAVLAIQRYSATQVQISWPAALTNFTLQYTSVLTPGGAWTNHPTTPLTVGDQSIVFDSFGPAVKFYRLKQ